MMLNPPLISESHAFGPTWQGRLMYFQREVGDRVCWHWGRGKAIPGGWLIPAISISVLSACYDVIFLVYLEAFPPCPTALGIYSSN